MKNTFHKEKRKSFMSEFHISTCTFLTLIWFLPFFSIFSFFLPIFSSFRSPRLYLLFIFSQSMSFSWFPLFSPFFYPPIYSHFSLTLSFSLVRVVLKPMKRLCWNLKLYCAITESYTFKIQRYLNSIANQLFIQTKDETN